MKKIFTLLAATTLFAGVAFADSVVLPTVTFSTQDGVVEKIDGEDALVLNSLDATVNINFSSTPAPEGAELQVFYAPGTADFTADMVPVTQIPVGNVLSLDLTKGNWGEPYMGEYHLTLMVTWLDEETGDFFYNDDEEPIVYQMPCVTPNTAPAVFLYAYPNETWEDGDSFTKAYKANGDGCRFNFNNIVDFADNDDMGEIVYTLKNGTKRYFGISLLGENEIQVGDTIPTGKATVGFNPLDGNYVVAVHYWTNTLSVDQISSVEITLWDMSSKGVAIPDEEASITNNAAEPTVQKIKKSRLVEGLGETDTTVDVYNLQGMLVKSNISKTTIQDLPAGLYIVNGKKVIIR